MQHLNALLRRTIYIMGKKIKILISCHKPSDYIQNEILTPIQVGTENSTIQLPGILHDNVGDNISSRNENYCELTAQYWAWKNVDAEYYGFFHYRRYLSFLHIDEPYDCWGNLVSDFIDATCTKKFGLDERTIQDVVDKYDVILPECKDILKMPNMGNTMKEQYLSSGYLHLRDLDLLMQILEERQPEFVPYAKQYFEGHVTYLNNMFIMRRDLFLSYSAWLFDLLDEFVKRADMRDYSIEALRTPGHLAERLLNIYCLYLRAQNKYSFCELQTVGFTYTDPIPEYQPAFSSNNVAVALSANNYYVPYVGVLLKSMQDHFTTNNNYDLLIMHRDISTANQKTLCSIFSGYENVSLRFIDIKRFENRFHHLFLRGHFVVETYFRLLMPELLSHYQKVLYLDSDIIVQADLADLYHVDVSGYLLAGCHDADTAGLYNGFEPQKKNYMDNVLKICEPYKYFQAGVLLFNLAEFRRTYTTDEMLRFAASYQWELLDQDVLNHLAQGRVKYADMSWNLMTDWRGIRISEIISRAPKYLQDEYQKARSCPKVIHYAGPDKPWQQPGSDFAEIFWSYARTSPFYEVLLQRLMEQVSHSTQPAPLHTRMKLRVKSILMPLIDFGFPKFTKRRETLKKILKAIKHLVKR